MSIVKKFINLYKRQLSKEYDIEYKRFFLDYNINKDEFELTDNFRSEHEENSDIFNDMIEVFENEYFYDIFRVYLVVFIAENSLTLLRDRKIDIKKIKKILKNNKNACCFFDIFIT